MIITFPHTILNTPTELVDFDNPGIDIHELKSQMINLMIEKKGIGLAANQIGINKQIFVMGQTESTCVMCVNPTVIQYTSDIVEDYEGCLSFPDIAVQVKRPKEILAKFYDENFEEQIVKLSDYTARVYLHEMDHLLGITMRDRVSNLKWTRTIKKLKKLKGKK